MRKMLNKIFFRKTGWGNVIIASLGYFLGLVIILLSFNLYLKFLLIEQQHGNFITLNKQVKFGVLNEADASFSDEEVNDLEQQVFIKKVGKFDHARFNAQIKAPQIGNLSSLLPLESVPDEFIDCDLPYKWRRYHKRWDPDKKLVPVVVSREMFNMLNLSFTFQQGIPQLSEDFAKSIPVDFKIWEGDKKYQLKAKIVGFSDRISSILVPDSFMKWANKELVNSYTVYSTRLIVETAGSTSSEFEAYMKDRGYVVSLDDLLRQKRMSALYITISIVAFLGLAFMALSVALVIAQFSMIVLSAKSELQLLLQLGYNRNKIGWHFGSIVMIYLFSLTVASLAVFVTFSEFVDRIVGRIIPSLSTGFETEVIFISIGIYVLCSIITIIQIQRALRSKQV